MDIICKTSANFSEMDPLVLMVWPIAVQIAQNMGATRITLTSARRDRKKGEVFSFHHA